MLLITYIYIVYIFLIESQLLGNEEKLQGLSVMSLPVLESSSSDPLPVVSWRREMSCLVYQSLVDEDFIPVPVPVPARSPGESSSGETPVLCSNIYTSMSSLNHSTLSTLTHCAEFQMSVLFQI